MPLPWLIGAAVLGLGAAIAAAVNSDDTSGSSAGNNGSNDEERRRREAAAEQARKDEREKKRKNARILFKEGGTQAGERLAGTLEGWVEFGGEPAFKVRLTPSGYAKRAPDQIVPHELGDVFAETFSVTDEEPGDILRNLDFFNEVYDVRLCGNARLYTRLMEIQAAGKELSELAKLRKKLERISQSKAEAIANLAETAT